MGWSESETAYFMAKLTKGEKIDLTQAPTEPQMMQEPESAAALQAEMDDT